MAAVASAELIRDDSTGEWVLIITRDDGREKRMVFSTADSAVAFCERNDIPLS